MLKRVVVTGMAGISPIGNDWQSMAMQLKSQQTGIQIMPDWQDYQGLNTRLGAPADFVKPEHYTRKQTRSMARVALLATRATELALSSDTKVIRYSGVQAPLASQAKPDLRITEYLKTYAHVLNSSLIFKRGQD